MMLLHKLKNKLSIVFLILLCIYVALYPFFVNGTQNFEIFHTDFFYLNIGIYFIGIIFLILDNTINRICISKLDIIVFLFIVFIGLHSIILKRSIFVVFPYINLFVIYLYVRALLSKALNCGITWGQIRSFVLIPFLSIYFIECLIGLFQYVGILNSLNSYFVLCGTFDNPTRLAGFLLIQTPFLLVILLKYWRIINRNRKIKFIFLSLLFIFSLGVLVILLSYNRASIFALLVSCVYILIKNKILKISAYKIVLILLLLFCFSVIFIKSNSTYGRLFIWKICFEYLYPTFLFGKGISSFTEIYNRSQGIYFENNRANIGEIQIADFVVYPYNDILLILIEIGVIGIIFLGIIVRNILSKQEYIHYNKEKMIGIQATCFAIGIFAMFSYVVNILPILLYIFIGLAIISSKQKQRFNIGISNRVSMNISYVMLFLFCGMFIFNIYVYMNYKTLKQIICSRIEDIELVKMQFENTRFIWLVDPALQYKYAYSLYISEKYEDAECVLVDLVKKLPLPTVYELLGKTCIQLGKIDKAEQMLEKGINIVPNRFKLKYELFKLYRSYNFFVKARKMAVTIKYSPVKIPSSEIYLYKSEVSRYLDSINDTLLR